MKKQSIFVAITLALAVVLTTSATAATYEFEDMIDTWYANGTPGGPDDAVWMGQFSGINNPLEYTHDLNDDVDFLAGDEVIEATLELDFTNADLGDLGDSYYKTYWDSREYATVYLEYNPSSQMYEEVDDGQYDIALDISWLNDDGFLDVKIQVSNPLGTGNVSLDHSRLYGTAQCVPVPGAVLLGILGLGAAGARLRKRS